MGKKLKKNISVLLIIALVVPSGLFGPLLQVDATSTTVYQETFANGQGAATQSGNATLTAVTDKFFTGNDDGAALYVSNRTNSWDAADFTFADIGLQDGKSYSISVTGYVDSGVTVPTNGQVVLSAVGSYSWLSNVNFVAGEAFTLTGEYTVGSNASDTKFRVQSSDEGATVPFYIGEVIITENPSSGTQTPETSREPSIDFTTVTFEDQTTSGFEGRAGTETLTVTNEANHTEGGSYSLKVEGRTQAWNGPALRVEQYIDEGYEYKISAWVKLISPESSHLQLSTQVGNSSPSYNNILGKTITTNDGWVLYEGTFRYNTVADEYVTIYVESSNNSTASFYIDDISFEPTGSGPIAVQTDLTPIKDVYQNDFLIGNAVSAADLQGSRLDLLKLHHNVVTAENAMKPGSLQAEKGVFTFDAANALVNEALANGLQMYGHVLVWHQQSPDWMNLAADGTPLSREEALTNMQTHIQTVMENFGDKVIGWDVVNEAMNDNPPNPTNWKASLRQSNWYKSIGADYVEQAFLAAKEVVKQNGWDIKLYYNDYNTDNQNKAEAIYQMVKDINDRYAANNNGDLLIDGIGMQGHYNLNTNPDNVDSSLEKFISLGVEVSVSELDIQAGSNGVQTEEEKIAQGYLYAQLFNIYKEHADNIARVTFWGLNDANSWRASASPLVFDKDLQAKPAYDAIIDPEAFITDNQPAEIETKQLTAAFGTPTIDGTVDSVWANATEIPVDQYQMAWQGATGTAKALWDSENLYVLVNVSDSQLDKTNTNAWEQDSVEVFLDQNNGKTSSYQGDDGQYRVNFDNETSFNPTSIAEGFESATSVSGTNYTVEMKIPLSDVSPKNGSTLGFDVQINDAKDGSRQSVATWNDPTGSAYQDTSVFGELTLTGLVAPSAPTALTVKVGNDKSVILEWEYPVDDTVTFTVYRSNSVDGTYTEIATNLSESIFTDTNLDSDTEYFYYVKAVRAYLESDASQPVSALTKMAPMTNVIASALNHHVIKVKWDKLGEPATYRVYRSSSADGQYVLIAEKMDDNVFVDNKLDASTTYYYKVVAVTKNNVSTPQITEAITKAKQGNLKKN
ncbi:endo-1,4-beta-xylanase [Aquibacillus salsiterrae]|uniref:Beta-xylanase n=1 Tax=Aquibacillus salsiterrae TaxID=2950439 RepID=A0A9X3WBQ2_9BACI|nr:endo-1,4-beta-xylanase [Aquibacillus salsiterrae]MDC3415813.1 endo-1,4-beta-xylanase [Aquibacillus salsiterrae]